MNPQSNTLISRAAMMLLMMMLTATTAWAQNPEVSYIDAFEGVELQPATARTLSLPDGVTASGVLFTDSGVDYYAPGSAVTLSDLPAAAAGYLGWQYTVNGTSIDGTSFFMPADANATVALTHQPDPDDFSVNDAGTEYTIHTADGWGVFCDAL